MKEIEQIVTDYLSFEKTDYAIMINGDWGCGKTYFIKKTLFGKISLIDSFSKDKKGNILKYEPLYVSLYGISETTNILHKIQLELNPWMKSKPWLFLKTGANKIASFFNVALTNSEEKNFLSIFDIKKNKVLFLDDLERIDDSKLSLSSVLGQINNFTEQENLKVIIVCNSSRTEEIFNEINEKTIRFSCKYEAVLGDIFDNIIAEYTRPYVDFLKEKKQIVIEIFQTAQYKNLRTLRFILDIFRKIYNQANQGEYRDEILKRFLFFTCIYAIEYKIGTNGEEDLNSLKNVGPYSIIDFDFDFLNPGVQEDHQEKDPSYSQLFSEKYSKIIESFFYCQEIADYIHNGYLNEEKLALVISDIVKDFKSKEGTEEDKIIKDIRNWRELKDEDFGPLIDKILARIDTGEFSLMAYPVIFAEFLQFEFYKIYDFEVTPEMIEMFKRGIDKSKENHKYLESFRFKVPMWSERDTTPAKNKYREISKYVIDANDFALTKEYVSISDLILTHLEQNKSDELQEVIVDPSNLNSPFFENIDVDKFFWLLIKANSETINAFNVGIYSRYSDNDIIHEPVFQNEKGFFEKLHELIVEHIGSVPQRKISTVQVIDLEKNLRRFVKKT